MISKKLLEKERVALEKSIKNKKELVKKLPDGKLQCHKAGNYYNWYVVNRVKEKGKSKVITKYIRKSQRKKAEALALKSLYLCDLRDEEQELRALNMYLRNKSDFSRRTKFLDRSLGFVELLSPYVDGEWDKYVEDWLDEEPYKDVPMPEGRKFRCANGMMVRSKSEQIIVAALVYNHIPFKYEYPLDLEDKTVFPDFTIMNQKTHEKIIWEHFGMMGDIDYKLSNINKLASYINNNYVPFVNLITTFEVDNSGIDEMWIEKIIETYLK